MNTIEKSTLIKFPVISFRRIENPYDGQGYKTYVLVTNIKNVPNELENWSGINPRDPNPNSGVSKLIETTLKDSPDYFFFRNRGLTLLAHKVTFNNSNNIVEIELLDENNNGLLDGGHTFKVIQNYIDSLTDDEKNDINAYIKIEIIEGITDHIEAVNIVSARNTSTQVKEQSLQELLKAYEDIHNILDSTSYGSRIAYKETEYMEDGSKKDIDIKEILSYLMCFDKELYNNDKHPISAYSSKSSVNNWFKDNKERVKKLIDLLPTILELRDIIYKELPEAYNEQKGKFGLLTGVVNTKKPSVELMFIDDRSTYKIPSGFIYPILASFRNLVKISNNQCTWLGNPIVFFQQNHIKKTLANRICEQALEFRNPNKLGKDQASWRSCHDFVAMEVLKLHWQ